MAVVICERQIKMISDIIVKRLLDKGQMWPLFATTADYAMNTFASEALSGFIPISLPEGPTRPHRCLISEDRYYTS